MRTFHIGGTAEVSVDSSFIEWKLDGHGEDQDLRVVKDSQGVKSP